MSKKFNAVVFGSITVDVFLQSPDFYKKEDLFGVPFGKKTEVSSKTICSGGGGSNVAVGLSRLGLKTAVAARGGQDRFALNIKEELSGEGVDTRLISVYPGEETDYSTILISKKGERSILVARGKTRLEEKDIDWSRLDADWFHLASLEGNLNLAESLLDFAGRNGIKVSWNPGSRELSQRDRVLDLVGNVDILILNQAEAEGLLKKKYEESRFWERMFELETDHVLITRGGRGACLAVGKEETKTEFDAFKIDGEDATGAGDAFCSGVIAALSYGFSPGKAVFWGLANGASVAEKIGAKAGLLFRKEMEKWLETRE